MIMLTVGTTSFPFKRLLRAVDQTLVNSESKEKLIAQIGTSDYRFDYKNTQIFSELSFGKILDYLTRARLVIAHGGAGTVFLALKYAKNKPLIVPRSRREGEHVDDHQIFFTKYMAKKNLIKVVYPDEDLLEKIRDFIERSEKNIYNEKKSSRRRLVERLTEYTEGFK